MIENLGSQIEKSIDKGPEAHHLIGLVIHKYYQGQFLCVDIGDDLSDTFHGISAVSE